MNTFIDSVTKPVTLKITPHSYAINSVRGPNLFAMHVFDGIEEKWIYISELTMEQVTELLPPGYYQFIKKGHTFKLEFNPAVTVYNNNEGTK